MLRSAVLRNQVYADKVTQYKETHHRSVT